MTERPKDVRRGLELLEQVNPPQWMSEMQRYYAQHGRFRPADLRRLMGTAGLTSEPVPEQQSRAVDLLQHLATKRK